MSRHRLLFAFHLSLLLLAAAALTSANVKNVYIVYMGEKKHDDPAQVEKSHHHLLATFLGSKAAAAESILYSYKHGFSGFAAHLTDPQARIIEGHSDVVHVVPNRMLKLHTTRSWDYLGLPLPTAQSTMGDTLLTQSHGMGEDVIIGVIDTGIWPESPSFADDGLGSIPPRWKGRCVDGEHFNSTLVCNRKLIGARWYVKAFLAEIAGSTSGIAEGDDDNPFDNEHMSTRDAAGHGTHTASTAGGSPVAGSSSDGGLARGTARGGAPAARLAIYKACWGAGSCASADLLKAFDDAIGDGVDVLSVSVGKSVPLFYELELQNGLTIGAFHAVARGVAVVFSAGNEGPYAGTVSNTAPWTISVAATTMDRAFPTRITLGNNQTILGQGMLSGKDIGFAKLKYYPSTMLKASGGQCSSLPKNESSMAGSILLCFHRSQAGMTTVKESGALGVIIATDRSLVVKACAEAPCVFVDYEVGTQIINYYYSSRSPTAKVSPSRTYVGKPLPTKIASFSSRGPNTIAPEILKPDIAAPGVNILAAYPPTVVLTNTTKVIPGTIYAFESGTSMACPHVAGIVALLRSVHPSWSPAAIRSALVTTASTTDQWGEPIISDGLQKIADPFDYGGGIVNPNKAVDPGLVYDMGMSEYIQYLCAMGYKYPALKRLTSKPVVCPTKRPSKLDVNVPAISIPNLHGLITVSRVVTNVGPVNSTYHASVVAPQGVMVSVMPNILVFNSSAKVQSFSVSFFSNHTVQGWYYFGSLTWSDGRCHGPVHKAIFFAFETRPARRIPLTGNTQPATQHAMWEAKAATTALVVGHGMRHRGCCVTSSKPPARCSALTRRLARSPVSGHAPSTSTALLAIGTPCR